jgi:hypothetical protein
MSTLIQAWLAIIVVGSFLIASTTFVLLVALGSCAWVDIKEILQWWFSGYSLLLGGIVGYYFRSPGK